MTRTPNAQPPAFVPDHRAIPGSVPAIVDIAFHRLRLQLNAAYDMRATSALDHAALADRLSVLHDRAARWWRVLYRHAPDGVPFLYVRAVGRAELHERDESRFWRDTAADWRARAERRPTSDAAGALSNWAELGVA
ncbi:hypothetical protein [Pseudonocardia pini]|uniref:hypothetical protein n=1 Tax=Pseudonocardia pini TaxID=2758030 RepID=UPI0015F0E881|nr:hypothetical protein [Pseudonocardia pini]